MHRTVLFAVVLWAGALSGTVARACPPIGFLKELLDEVGTQQWRATQPVPRPGFWCWLARYGLGPVAGSYRRCAMMRKEFQYMTQMDCVDSGLKPGETLARMAGLDPATTSVVRLPQKFVDRFSVASHGWFQGEDPGMGPGSGEDYVLIRDADGKSELPSLLCLVHGIGFDRSAFKSARTQLKEMGVTDPALLALAWDKLPPGRTDPNGLLVPISAMIAVLFFLRTFVRSLRESHPWDFFTSGLRLVRGTGLAVGGVIAAYLVFDLLLVAFVWGVLLAVAGLAELGAGAVHAFRDFVSGRDAVRDEAKPVARPRLAPSSRTRPPRVPVPPRLTSRPDQGHCPACSARQGPALWVLCPSCETPHHEQCWTYVGGCAMFGCRSSGVGPDLPPLEQPKAKLCGAAGC
ncbi:MAG: hypothetical protein HY815_04465 [Candidatus Riflebacteria bacterium]|nr:hypothetical protein [Candidatus Riflebacteria bacterium]